jgi:hypothetical protein
MDSKYRQLKTADYLLS